MVSTRNTAHSLLKVRFPNDGAAHHSGVTGGAWWNQPWHLMATPHARVAYGSAQQREKQVEPHHRLLAEQFPLAPLILVVEDDEPIRTMMEDLLSMGGYRTISMASAAAAEQVLQQEQPDLAILDIWLEQLDSGWRLLDKLQCDPQTESLPVIVYSAHDTLLSKMQHRFPQPHYVFLDKPFNIGKLLATVAELVRRRQPAHQSRH